MFDLNKRQILLMKFLINANQPISSEVLSSVLGASSRTIRTDIKTLEMIFENFGARVLIKSGIGYSLEIFDAGEYAIFMQTFNDKYWDSTAIPFENSERIRYIINRLLTANECVKSDSFIDELFVSKSTFSSDLGRAREILKGYRVEIVSQSNKGLCIKGAERNIRNVFTDFMFVDEDVLTSNYVNPVFELDSKFVNDALIEILLEHDIHISNQSVSEVVNQILVADYRMKRHHFIEMSDIEIEEALQYEECDAAQKLSGQLLMKIPEAEVINMALILVARRIYDYDDDFSLSKHKSSYFLGDEMLKFLFIYTNVDFSEDFTIRKLLARELRGLLVRIIYGYDYRNLSLTEIKRNNIAYEYAVIMGDYLQKKYGYIIVEEEISIIANILHYSLVKDSRRIKKYDVCMVYQRGRNFSLLARQKLVDHFSPYINSIRVAEFYEYRLRNYDLIVTDFPISKFEDKDNVYQINNNFEYQERRELRKIFKNTDVEFEKFMQAFSSERLYFDLESDNAEDAIRIIADRSIQTFKSSGDFCEMVLHRESISSTERGNNVAITHSLFPVSHDPIISIGILKKPIRWNREVVQVVFMIGIGKDEDSIFFHVEWLQKLINNINFVHDIMHISTLSNVHEVIHHYFNQVSMNDN
ncbi:PTS transporter subunit EIIA [Erysipelothrix sp. HDW6C]|uniref:BglG family transcription antiterminator n=1 Tax=Erysipelothrix sp. HDW6C TaxID=2714930 RepID=UPI001407F769|nr:PTS sugar transporter subunit IIA [Erysipelothrix sp. HDW6C]QIK70677.1 PTS transporter subunit EIIA [Erysipelothrix sp. HDW6C]